MSLSTQQLEEMYKASIECSRDLSHICKQLDKGDEIFLGHGKRITKIEKEQSLLKGKLGAFVLFLTLCVTMIIHGIGWILSHLWSSKGGP